MTGIVEPRPATLDPEEERRRFELVPEVHAALVASWRQHGIELPPLDETWHRWLRDAVDVSNDAEAAEPNLRMAAVAVPPAEQFLDSVRNTYVHSVIQVLSPDAARSCPDWRLLAVDMRPRCGNITTSTVREFLERYAEIGGHPTFALSILEYASCVWQSDGRGIDMDPFGYTPLLGNMQHNSVPLVTTDHITGILFSGFELELDKVYMPPPCFRVAVEIPHPDL